MSLIEGTSSAVENGYSATMPGQKAHGNAPTVVIRPTRNWAALKLGELWEYRELAYLLVWRDVKVRYKQTFFGAAWAILQPLFTMLVFNMVFGHFAKVPSDNAAYPVFAFSALLPWTYFAQAVSRSGTSLVGSANLISKVYFPRLIVPIAAALAPIVDFAFAFLVMIGLMIYYGIAPTVGVFLLPFFLLLALATALSVGLWLTALNVKYRDVGHILPFLIQIWLYASPIAYPLSMVPERWRWLYSLNPMVGVVEGFRWALIGKASPDWTSIVLSVVIVAILLAGGLAFFKRTERTFADVI